MGYKSPDIRLYWGAHLFFKDAEYHNERKGQMKIIIFAVIALAIIFFIILIKFRNRVMEYQENIKKAKSRVRVEQNTYSKQVRNTQRNQQHITAYGAGAIGSMGAGYLAGNLGASQAYKTGTSMMGDLAKSYEQAQYALNDLISEYNMFISAFPNLILAAILRCKKEAYIDEPGLEHSTELRGIDSSVV